jgi:hypothetical protein
MAVLCVIGAGSCKQVDLDSCAGMSREAVVLTRLKKLPTSRCPSLTTVTNGLTLSDSSRSGQRSAYKISDQLQLVVVLDEKAREITIAAIDRLLAGRASMGRRTARPALRAIPPDDLPVSYRAIVSADGEVLFEKSFGGTADSAARN